ncbi:ABC transporter ATP-binding protein [Pseudomonas sp. F1_0610]|uniref:ABC transporter ATP-binding protein n=1 Tax=Pseudomonas sp. F1_0610 TaxID=3114284 RepID=UPI0039C23B41
MPNPVLVLDQVRFAYPKQKDILDIPSFSMLPQEKVFLQGPSGSGKTTLLGLLAGVLTTKYGQIRLLDTSLSSLSNKARDQFRADHIGFIFQQFNLLPFLSVRQNVALSCRFSKQRKARLGDAQAISQRIEQLLSQLGLEPDLYEQRADQLSIGQQQRVAAARALLGSPSLIIADEPTSALDYQTREHFIECLFEQCTATGSSLLFVSHDQNLAPLFDRTVALQDINQVAKENV